MMMAKWWLLLTLSDTPESSAGPIKCTASAISQAINHTCLASLYPHPGLGCHSYGWGDGHCSYLCFPVTAVWWTVLPCAYQQCHSVQWLTTLECVSTLLCLAQTMTKMRRKCGFYSFQGKNLKSCPKKTLEKIVRCCSNTLYHSVFSDYAEYPHSTHKSHFSLFVNLVVYVHFMHNCLVFSLLYHKSIRGITH